MGSTAGPVRRSLAGLKVSFERRLRNVSMNVRWSSGSNPELAQVVVQVAPGEHAPRPPAQPVEGEADKMAVHPSSLITRYGWSETVTQDARYDRTKNPRTNRWSFRSVWLHCSTGLPLASTGRGAATYALVRRV